jgi:hypothetical protein
LVGERVVYALDEATILSRVRDDHVGHQHLFGQISIA